MERALRLFEAAQSSNIHIHTRRHTHRRTHHSYTYRHTDTHTRRGRLADGGRLTVLSTAPSNQLCKLSSSDRLHASSAGAREMADSGREFAETGGLGEARAAEISIHSKQVRVSIISFVIFGDIFLRFSASWRLLEDGAICLPLIFAHSTSLFFPRSSRYLMTSIGNSPCLPSPGVRARVHTRMCLSCACVCVCVCRRVCLSVCLCVCVYLCILRPGPANRAPPC